MQIPRTKWSNGWRVTVAHPKIVRAAALNTAERLYSITHFGDGTSVCHNCCAVSAFDPEVTFDSFPHREDCSRARKAAFVLLRQLPAPSE
jgi:hypothetical protein